MSTFKLPVQVYRNQRHNDGNDVADVVASSADFVTFSDTTAKTLSIVVPENTQFIEIYLDTPIAYNAATTLDIGVVGGADDAVVSAATVTDKGRVLGSASATNIADWVDSGSASIRFTAKVTGTALTAGQTVVNVVFANRIDTPS